MTRTAATPLETLAQQIARQQAELEALCREYATRQTNLTDLKQQKKALEAQLRQVEADIRATIQGGSPGSAPSRPVTPAAPGPKALQAKTAPSRPAKFRKNSLPALLLKILRKAGSPQTVKQLAAEVVRRKHPTTSSNLPAMVDVRVRELVKKGFIQSASDQPGFVLAAAAKAGKGSIVSQANGAKNGAGLRKATAPAKEATASKPPSLKVTLTNVLAQSRRPLSGRELAELALANGYQTKSKDFIEVVWVTLGHMDNIKNVAGKGYVLKKR